MTIVRVQPKNYGLAALHSFQPSEQESLIHGEKWRRLTRKTCRRCLQLHSQRALFYLLSRLLSRIPSINAKTCLSGSGTGFDCDEGPFQARHVLEECRLEGWSKRKVTVA